jgi:hypothetical protein|tara:strand:+ start:1747 stop:2055 length:309 start_codon:yes stop_codon:yes gene_type:complete
MVNFKTQNSVQDMVEVLKVHGTLSEKEISTKAFGYTRGASFGSNKKYADMLRRGMKKGIIGRIGFPDNALKHGRTKFIYFATKPTQIECSITQDNEWANESI